VRVWIVVAIVLLFLALGALDIATGNYKVGVASILLGVVNGLLVS
jgi:hypothetical protein